MTIAAPDTTTVHDTPLELTVIGFIGRPAASGTMGETITARAFWLGAHGAILAGDRVVTGVGSVNGAENTAGRAGR